MTDFILYLINAGAVEIIVSGVPYGECNAMSDAIMDRLGAVVFAACDPVSEVTA